MVPLAKCFGKKCVVTIHGLDWQRAKWGGFATRFLRFGERMAAKYADEIIVLSASMQQYFADTYHRQTVRIENGIDPPETADLSPLSRFGLEKDSYILFLGRIVPEKGIHYLIDAYHRLQTDKKLVIAGGASHSEEYFNQLKAKAAGDARIVFTDFVQGAPLAALYAGAYLYCLPSDLEGMPISLLEAMSYGNCCVTSDIPECTEVCGDHGFAFQKGNTADLKRLLEQLLSQPDMVKRCKATAADYILQKYNWGQVTERTLELYEQVKRAK
jgi:glycosyltransferase involved in cell wall biosynthesis